MSCLHGERGGDDVSVMWCGIVVRVGGVSSRCGLSVRIKGHL